jgi:TatD DNase family protein
MQEWRRNGLEYVVSVSSNFSESLRSIELHRKYDEIIPGIGIHPWKAKRSLNDEQKYKFNQIVEDNLPVVIGEFGLDRHFIKKEEYYAHQDEIFHFFLSLAEKHNLPINLHLKGAEGLGAEILETYEIPPHNILIHWYSGPENILKKFIERDYFFSINPSILGGSKHIIVLIKAELNQILTESDGNVKYTIDGERIVGSPAIVPKIIEKISEEKEKDALEISNILHSNLRTYLNLG